MKNGDSKTPARLPRIKSVSNRRICNNHKVMRRFIPQSQNRRSQNSIHYDKDYNFQKEFTTSKLAYPQYPAHPTGNKQPLPPVASNPDSYRIAL